MTKEEAIKRLQVIVDNSNHAPHYEYEIYATDWAKYGKSRTYFKIVETKDNSKHSKERDYGYLNNLSGEYVAGKHDLNENYTFSGSRF